MFCSPLGWHFAAKYPKVAELNEAHQKLFNRPSDPLVGPSYACVQILADAMTRAKTLTATSSATPSPPQI